MLKPSERFTKVDKLRPTLNVGCLFDIPTGTYHIGEHGESILSGGYSNFMGVCGRGNTYKSTVMHFFNLSALNRYGGFATAKSPVTGMYMVYDTENSLNPGRLEHLSWQFPFLKDIDLDNEEAIMVTDTTMMGNEYFDALKAMGKERAVEKSNKGLTPFINPKDGKPIPAIKPTFVGMDSLSMMPIKAVETIYDKNQIGESGMNVEAMKTAAAKSQMMMQIPNVTAHSGMWLMASAHLGDQIEMDPYAPSKKKLGFLKQGTSFKRVPENFSFLTNVLYCCLNASVLHNQSDKTPLFPRNQDDRMVGDTDLQLITIQALRSKGGGSGLPFEVIASQRDGLLVGLSEFYFIKKRKYGISGNDRNYHLDLVPDVSLQRTTVRGIIDSNAKIRRALEITSEMCQIFSLWKDLPEEIKCTPAQLFEDIKKLGGDWDQILEGTRGYWVFKDQDKDHPLKFLSTMDLLRWRAGLYKPYWL